MLKYVGFCLLSLCLIGILGQEATVTVEAETTADPFGGKSDIAPTTVAVPETKTTTSAAKTTTTPVTITAKHETTPDAPTTTPDAPTTTPDAPTTTPDAPTTTPDAPTTTPEAPTTTPAHETTTVEPVSPVTPTALPAAEPGLWNIKDDEDTNITCIRAKMAVQFKVFYNGEEYSHNLSPNATSDKSTCHPRGANHTQLLVLEDEGYLLTVIFFQDSSSVYVQNISLSLSKEFAYEVDAEKYFEVKTNKSYLCNSKSTIKIGNATLEFTDVHLQAFMHTEKDYSQDVQCSADYDSNNIVPIAVAIALGSLVIIILIFYLIQRRRSQKKDYQSM